MVAPTRATNIFYHLKSNSLELYSLWCNPVGFGDFTQHFARHTCGNHAFRYVGSYNASRAYHTPLAYRHTATNGGVCANPNTIFNSDWLRCFERAGAALLWVNGVACASKHHARTNQHTSANANRRCVEKHAIIIHQRKALEMNVESKIAPETGHQIHRRIICAKQAHQYVALRLGVVGVGIIEFPTQAARFGLSLTGNVHRISHKSFIFFY